MVECLKCFLDFEAIQTIYLVLITLLLVLSSLNGLVKLKVFMFKKNSMV
jgi:hypothetical protein